LNSSQDDKLPENQLKIAMDEMLNYKKSYQDIIQEK